MAGKGSKPRPLAVDYDTFSDNWERIFGNKNDSPKYVRPQQESEDEENNTEQLDANSGDH